VGPGVIQFGFKTLVLFPQLGGFLAKSVGIAGHREHAGLELQLFGSAICAQLFGHSLGLSRAVLFKVESLP
jgi:hypothetical protein